MKKTLRTVLGALGLAGAMAWTAPAAALEGLTANAAVTSNYVFRGISQSAEDPAVQAGLDYDLGAAGLSGFSVGTWASSIDFGDGTHFEWDLFAGYTGAITEQFSWSINTIAYLYPNSASHANYNWHEYWFGLAYNPGPLSLTGRIYYSPDYVNLSTRQIYYTAGVSVPIAPWLALNGSVGYTDLENDIPPLIQSYTDWSISLAATFEAYTITVGYADTDLDGIYKVSSGPFHTGDHVFVMFGFRFM